MRASYTYCENDLLREKAQYNFSPFGGEAFLADYEAVRRRWRAKAAQAGVRTDITILVRLHALIARRERPDAPVPLADAEEQPLSAWLEHSIFVIGLDPDALMRSAFPRVLQRFEVQKRLWTTIKQDFRKGAGAVEGGTELYALFSLHCWTAYLASEHLSFVNAMLKANDILCSQDPSTLCVEAVSLADAAIEAELEVIARLRAKVGLT